MGSRISIMGRYVEPSFHSFGTGYIFSDNMRYELRLDQKLFSSLRVSGFYRQEKNNVLSGMNFTNTIRSAGITLSGTLNRNLSISGSYSPIIQNSVDEKELFRINNKNDISNLSLVYTKQLKTTYIILNGIYCLYRFTDTTGNYFLFNNAGGHITVNTLKTMEHFSIDYFKSNSIDSAVETTLLFNVDFSCTLLRKVTGAAGLQYALKNIDGSPWGGLLKVGYAYNQLVSVSAEVTRVVKGDFYSSFSGDAIDQFPYFLSTRVIFHIP